MNKSVSIDPPTLDDLVNDLYRRLSSGTRQREVIREVVLQWYNGSDLLGNPQAKEIERLRRLRKRDRTRIRRLDEQLAQAG